MSTLLEFTRQLLQDGTVMLEQRPQCTADDRRAAAQVLSQIYGEYRLDIAGPPLEFDAKMAVAAAELLWNACWFLLSHEEPEAQVRELIRMPGPPASAAAHLSADLMLRFVPQIQRRARAVAADDVFATLLSAVLRQWPLSGVLGNDEDVPTTDLEFCGHPGLLLCYAERLARNRKGEWIGQGSAQGYLELVLQERR